MRSFVYISSCIPEGGVYTFEITPQNTLKQVAFLPLDRPMYTIRRADGVHILLRAPFKNSEESGILSCKILENGVLEPFGEIQSTRGVVGCHLCAEGDNLYAVNYISGSVWKSPDLVVQHIGKGVHPTRQEKAHTHYVTLTPDNQYILVTDLGTDKIYTYTKDLDVYAVANAPSGAGPRHLAFSEDGKLCYCANELSSTVSVYRYDSGKLTHLSEYSTLPQDFNGENTSAAIRCEDGYVYVSNRGHNSIACFKAEGNALVLQNIFGCGGAGPRDFIIKDNLLICTNENSGDVVIFEKTDTEWKEIQKIKIPCVLCATV
ncbi:MAG: lactonase family protein [Clostridia bacterium]|nr:lactonase family protein [Clostridia bacterium]